MELLFLGGGVGWWRNWFSFFVVFCFGTSVACRPMTSLFLLLFLDLPPLFSHFLRFCFFANVFSRCDSQVFFIGSFVG